MKVAVLKSSIWFCPEDKKSDTENIMLHFGSYAHYLGFCDTLLGHLSNPEILDKLIPCYKKNKDPTKGYEWEGMPEYVPVDLSQNPEVRLVFRGDDQKRFIKQFIFDNYGVKKLTNKSCWIPERPDKLNTFKDKICFSGDITPKYPIYIISKGRAALKKSTANYLIKCGIDFKIVVEPSEFAEYKKYYTSDILLVAPEDFSRRGQGGIPVRNFVWEHSISTGAKRHWILDDNISCYYRVNESQKTKILSGAIFKSVEDYTDRYENVKMSGHNYSFEVVAIQNPAPVYKNKRVFSSILLSNDIYPQFAWRGRYNEDVDLFLRILKAGHCTLSFNHIAANKAKTMNCKGGNTDTIYAVEDYAYKKAKELYDNHTDCVIMKKKYGRMHHEYIPKNLPNPQLVWKSEKSPITDYELEYVRIEDLEGIEDI